MRGWVQFWKWVAGIMESGEIPGRASSNRFAAIITIPIVFYIAVNHSVTTDGNLNQDVWFGLLAFVAIGLGFKAIEKVLLKRYNGNSNGNGNKEVTK